MGGVGVSGVLLSASATVRPCSSSMLDVPLKVPSTSPPNLMTAEIETIPISATSAPYSTSAAPRVCVFIFEI